MTILEYAVAIALVWKLATIKSIHWYPANMARRRTPPQQLDLTTKCPVCQYAIPPAEVRRISFDDMQCPKCQSVFKPSAPVLRRADELP